MQEAYVSFLRRYSTIGVVCFIQACFILMSCSSLSHAQDPYHIIYDVNDGLPSDELYDLYVAADNLIWIATDRGISTYDGYEFKTYSQKDGLAYPTNFKVISDQFNRIWFNGYDGSLSVFNSDSFHKVVFNDAYSTSLIPKDRNYFNNVGVDSAGSIFTHRLRGSYIGSNSTIYSVKKDGKLEQIVHRFDTLGKSDTHKFTLERAQFVNTDFYRIMERKTYLDVVYEIEEDKILFAVRKSINRNRRNGRPVAELFLLHEGKIHKLFESINEITSIYVDHYSNVLISTFSGILMYPNGDITQKPQVLFQNTAFTSVTQDYEGNYWASTKSGLIFIPTLNIDPAPFNTTIIKVNPLGQHLILKTAHHGVRCLKNGSIMPKLLTAKSFNTGKYFDYNNAIILNSGNQFIAEKNKDLKVTSIDESKDIRRHSDESDFYNAAEVVRNTFRNLRKIPSMDSYKWTQTVNVDHNNNVWIGTLKALYVIESKNQNHVRKLSDSVALLNTRISDIEISGANDVWVSTLGNGIVQFCNGKISTVLNQETGLSSDLINQMYLETDSVLWVCGNRGLDKVIIRKHSGDVKFIVTNFNNVDGLPSNYVYDFAYWDKHYWIATSKGLAKFKSTDSLIVKNKPTLEITAVFSDGEYFDTDSTHVLQPNQNDVTFRFKGISYRKPTRGFYTYTLDGYEKPTQWKSTDHRYIEYTNLAPGDYVFRVKAGNKYDQWSEERTFGFTIRPHFTDTWWFWLLCFIGVTGVLRYIYLRRIRYENRLAEIRRSAAEAHLKNEIAELTRFRNQFNPHFIFNALNSIQQHILDDDAIGAANFLSKFSKLIRQSLNLSTEVYITIAKEFDFLENYLILERQKFTEKFQFDFKNVHDVILDDYLIPPLLLQPAVENVIKHAFENTENGILSIEIRNHSMHEAFIIQIVDNGRRVKSYDKADNLGKRRSLGLKIIRDRIALLNISHPRVSSSFELESDLEGAVTVAKFVIPKIHAYENFTSSNNRR